MNTRLNRPRYPQPRRVATRAAACGPRAPGIVYLLERPNARPFAERAAEVGVPGRTVLLAVEGDGLAPYGVQDGDQVAVRLGQSPEFGDVVLVPLERLAIEPLRGEERPPLLVPAPRVGQAPRAGQASPGTPAPRAGLASPGKPAPRAGLASPGKPAPRAGLASPGKPAPRAGLASPGKPAPRAGVASPGKPAPRGSETLWKFRPREHQPPFETAWRGAEPAAGASSPVDPAALVLGVVVAILRRPRRP